MELHKVLGRLRLTGVVFLLIFLIGSGVYYRIAPEAGVVNAFYMTAITVSTIGYYEVIDLSHHPWGRIFTIILAFSGIGVITYFFSNMATLFTEGEIRRAYQRKKMEKKIARLADHYIICGCGRVGRHIALELHKTKRHFVAADRHAAVFSSGAASDKLRQAVFLVGDCTDDDFLRQLGVERAAGVFVTSGDDNTNLVITLSVRTLNSAVKIVTVNKDINHRQKLQKAGADKVVTPNFIGGLRMAAEMLNPHVTSFLDEMLHSDMHQRIEQIDIPPAAEGRLLGSLGIDKLEQTVVLAVRRHDGWTYKPKPSHLLTPETALVVLTDPKEREKIENILNRPI